jgi:uncharacterized integral membrane protein (TIGR00698 family)
MQAALLEANRFEATWHGLALSLVVGIASVVVGKVARDAGLGNISSMTVALCLGLLVGNSSPVFVDAGGPGVAIAKREILRTAIVLYGFRLTLADFAAGGAEMFILDTLVVGSTFLVSIYIGCRLLKMDFDQAALVGVGAAICGNSAVLATSTILKSDSGKCAIAVATVAVFGTAAFALYPAIFRVAGGTWLFPGDPAGYGTYVGATVHEVAQVVATADAIGGGAVDAAVVAKMGRVALLAPFLCALLWWRGRSGGNGPLSLRNAIPLFPFLFVATVVFNSVVPLDGVRHAVALLDGWALATSMGALGLTTRIAAIQAAGTKPLALGAALFGWLVVGGALASKLAQLLAGAF